MHEARYLGSLEPLASSAAGVPTRSRMSRLTGQSCNCVVSEECIQTSDSTPGSEERRGRKSVGARKVPGEVVTKRLRSGQQPVAEIVSNTQPIRVSSVSITPSLKKIKWRLSGSHRA
jgi:hypothetical protein